MGTHMWTNGTSRRGRRMSLELPPLQIGNGGKEPDFLQRRPDIYYHPFLPGPFLNGIHQQKVRTYARVHVSVVNRYFRDVLECVMCLNASVSNIRETTLKNKFPSRLKNIYVKLHVQIILKSIQIHNFLLIINCFVS